MANIANPMPAAGLSALAGKYRFLLCDVWGVVHNGMEASSEAAAALARFRQDGGLVLLITNAPRPGVKVFPVGPKRDLPLYDGLDVVLTGEADAEIVACTGLFDDETESPEDYDPSMRRWVARRLPLLCANPDRVVERGPRLLWCAGAL